jgi:pyruvate/2-oxoacid:ferredoxin oxidoreductase alpha subunit
VCRATANYPLCIEGDPSDTLAHRDDGFIQFSCRGKQQIYDTILQLPALGMHPDVLTPTMPVFYGIKDSHRSSRLVVEADDAVNAFLDDLLSEANPASSPTFADFLDKAEPFRKVPPGLLDGDTSMGNCVTSSYFQGFKAGQKERGQRALELVPTIGKRFAERFGRPGLEYFERHDMDDDPEVVLVCMGPDAGTVIHLLPMLRSELRMRVGVLVVRMLTPFPRAALGAALRRAAAVGVVNNAHHHGRGHLTIDVADALADASRTQPIESFFCGLGGADVSVSTWRKIAEITCEAARAGHTARPWHLLHDGIELASEG